MDCKYLYNNETFSGVIVQYKTDATNLQTIEIKCHKIILFNATTFFAEQCEAPNDLSGQKPQVVTIEEPPEVAQVVLRHVYSFTYAEIQESLSRADQLEKHLEVIKAAQKYGLPKLEQDALAAIDNSINLAVDGCTTLKGAEKLADCVIFLMNSREDNGDYEKRAKAIARKHLPWLCKVYKFRKAMEKKGWNIIRALVTQAVERGCSQEW